MSPHRISEDDEGNLYDTWTVAFIPWNRPGLAKEIIEEVERINPGTHCSTDIRIEAHTKLPQKQLVKWLCQGRK